MSQSPEGPLQPEQSPLPPLSSESNLSPQEIMALPKAYTAENGMVIGYEIEDENKKTVMRRGVITDVCEPGTDSLILWRIENDAIGLGSQSTHMIFKPFIIEGQWNLSDIEEAVKKYYAGDQLRDISALEVLKPEDRAKLLAKLTPEAIARYKQKDHERVVKLIREKYVEGKKRTVTDDEIKLAAEKEKREKKSHEDLAKARIEADRVQKLAAQQNAENNPEEKNNQ